MSFDAGTKRYSALKYISAKDNESINALLNQAIDDLLSRKLQDFDIKFLQSGAFGSEWQQQ